MPPVDIMPPSCALALPTSAFLPSVDACEPWRTFLSNTALHQTAIICPEVVRRELQLRHPKLVNALPRRRVATRRHERLQAVRVPAAACLHRPMHGTQLCIWFLPRAALMQQQARLNLASTLHAPHQHAMEGCCASRPRLPPCSARLHTANDEGSPASDGRASRPPVRPRALLRRSSPSQRSKRNSKLGTTARSGGTGRAEQERAAHAGTEAGGGGGGGGKEDSGAQKQECRRCTEGTTWESSPGAPPRAPWHNYGVASHMLLLH